MAVVIFFKEDALTVITESVLFFVLALVSQMLSHRRDLNNLLALPTGGQERAVLPVVNIERIRGEVLIVGPTEVADLRILFFLAIVLGIIDVATSSTVARLLLIGSDLELLGVVRGLLFIVFFCRLGVLANC